MEGKAKGKGFKMKGHTLPGINQRSETKNLPDGRSPSSALQYESDGPLKISRMGDKLKGLGIAAAFPLMLLKGMELQMKHPKAADLVADPKERRKEAARDLGGVEGASKEQKKMVEADFKEEEGKESDSKSSPNKKSRSERKMEKKRSRTGLDEWRRFIGQSALGIVGISALGALGDKLDPGSPTDRLMPTPDINNPPK